MVINGLKISVDHGTMRPRNSPGWRECSVGPQTVVPIGDSSTDDGEFWGIQLRGVVE